MNITVEKAKEIAAQNGLFMKFDSLGYGANRVLRHYYIYDGEDKWDRDLTGDHIGYGFIIDGTEINEAQFMKEIAERKRVWE